MAEVTAPDETPPAAGCPPTAPHRAFRLAVRMQRGQLSAESVASASNLDSTTLALVPEALQLAFHLSYVRLLVEARVEALEAAIPTPETALQSKNRAAVDIPSPITVTLQPTNRAAAAAVPPAVGEAGPCLLDSLPTEVLFTVMSRAGLHACSRLGLCSHSWSALLLRWLGERAAEEMPRMNLKPGHLQRWGGWGVLGYGPVEIPEGELGYAAVVTAAYARDGMAVPHDALACESPTAPEGGPVAPPPSSYPPPQPPPESLLQPSLQQSSPLLSPPPPPPPLLPPQHPVEQHSSEVTVNRRPTAAPLPASALSLATPSSSSAAAAAPSPPPSSSPSSSSSSRCPSPRSSSPPRSAPSPSSPPSPSSSPSSPSPTPSPPARPPAAATGALFDLLITQTTDFLSRGGKPPARALLRGPRNELLRRGTVTAILRAVAAATAHGPAPEAVLATLDSLCRQLRTSKPHSNLPPAGVGWVLRVAQAHRHWTAHDLVRAHLLTHYRDGPSGACCPPDASLLPPAPPLWYDTPAPARIYPTLTHAAHTPTSAASPPTLQGVGASSHAAAAQAQAAVPPPPHATSSPFMPAAASPLTPPPGWQQLSLEHFLVEELRHAKARSAAVHAFVHDDAAAFADAAAAWLATADIATAAAAAAADATVAPFLPNGIGPAAPPLEPPFPPLFPTPPFAAPPRPPAPAFSPAVAAAAALCRMGATRRGCPTQRTRELIRMGGDTAGGGQPGAGAPIPNTGGGHAGAAERNTGGGPSGAAEENTAGEEEPNGDRLWTFALSGLHTDPPVPYLDALIPSLHPAGPNLDPPHLNLDSLHLNLDPSGVAWALVCGCRLAAERRCRDAWREATADTARLSAKAFYACLRGSAEAERRAPLIVEEREEGSEGPRVRLSLSVFFGRVSAATRVQPAPRSYMPDYVTRLEAMERLHTYPTPLLADLIPATGGLQPVAESRQPLACAGGSHPFPVEGRRSPGAMKAPVQGPNSELAPRRFPDSQGSLAAGHGSRASRHAAEGHGGAASRHDQPVSGAGPSIYGGTPSASGPARSSSGAAHSILGTTSSSPGSAAATSGAAGPAGGSRYSPVGSRYSSTPIPGNPCSPAIPPHALALLRSYLQQAPFSSPEAAAHFVFTLCSERFGPPEALQMQSLGKLVTPAVLGAVAAEIGMTKPQVVALRSLACGRSTRAFTLTASHTSADGTLAMDWATGGHVTERHGTAADGTGDEAARAFTAAWASGMARAGYG